MLPLVAHSRRYEEVGDPVQVNRAEIRMASGYILSLFLLRAGLRRLGFAFLVFAVALLWAASTPLVSRILTVQLELRFPVRTVQSLPTADAILLLGGVLSQPLPPRLTPDLGEAADRVLQTITLYKARKAPYIVITGGNLPWQEAIQPEARLIGDLLIEFGVPASALVLETQSRNTRENAVKTAEIFAARGWHTGLLVTSGVHMPRALATFQKVGLEMTPVATDIQIAYPLIRDGFDFLPDANALSQTTRSMKEFLGILAYRTRNWM